MLLNKLQQSQVRHQAAYLQLEDMLKGEGPSRAGSAMGFSPTPDGSKAPSVRLPGGAAGPSGASRPPRPRGPPGYAAASAADGGGAAGPSPGAASARSNSRPGSSSSRSGPARCAGRLPRRSADAHGPPVAAALAGGKSTPLPEKALSSCSTASGGGGGQGTSGSGQSTPMSSCNGPSITYTTVDGLQLDIPTEEDLDLASLLNS